MREIDMSLSVVQVRDESMVLHIEGHVTVALCDYYNLLA